MADEVRIEHDSLGDVAVPLGAAWGAQTQRAVENFRFSNYRMPLSLVSMVARIKAAAATANAESSEVGGVDDELGAAIAAAAREVIDGRWDDQFPIDVFQTGSGTSTNMNANEVIARRAAELAGRDVHPNDHVNASQSSNDVIPTAIRLAAAVGLRDDLLPAIDALRAGVLERADAFAEVVKSGRTHLMDAAPLFLGDEFGAWAEQLAATAKPVARVIDELAAVPLGGSAVGTGLNVPAGWADRVLRQLDDELGLGVRASPSRFAAMAGGETYAEASAAVRGVAIALTKIANDLRWLSSGPFCGLAEIHLPELQPGSSIMPGKVNPVIPEAVAQASARIIGNDVTVGIAAASGNLDLNTYLPLIAFTLDESIGLATAACRSLADRCVAGIEADVERCRRYAESSPALITGLARTIGYERAAHLVQQAVRDGSDLRTVLAADGFAPDELDAALDPIRSARGG